MTYDPLNRLTSVVYSATQRIDYVYDAAGNLIEERINGAAGLSVTAQASPLAGGIVTISPPQSSFVAGDAVTVTATPTAGYTFTGWSGAPGCTNASACTFNVGSTNIAVVANFSVPSNLQPLRVIAVPAGGGTIAPTPNPAGYAPGTPLSFTASTVGDWTVDAWYGAGCTLYSGATCAFNMPATASDVFVSFKQPGSGQELFVSYGAISGVTYNPFAAGVVEVTPAQRRIPAGTPVTLKFRPATGYAFYNVYIYGTASGVYNYTLCAAVTNFLWIPGEEPSCTFNMPAEDLTLVPVFMPDPKRYSVDVSASPVNGGNVSIVDTPTFPGQMWQRLYQNGFTNVAATVPLTLTANPAGGRSFVRWLNGPCANSTEPVCSFVMPSSPVTSNPLFGDEPDSACAYAVSAPSFAFPGVGGSRIVTITTQAGCGFNTAVFDNQRVGDIVATTTGNTVTLSVPAFTPNYGRTGVLRIHTGREVFSLPFMQAGNSSDSQTNAATVDFGTVGVADVGTVTRTVAFTNSTASALTVSSIVTRGSFAIRSSTCSASLAIGASCNVLVEFVPRKAGTMLGELLIGSKGHTFAAPLIGTATATRENVAAATAGATVSATTQLNPVDYPVLALIDGDRRMTPPNQTPWVSSRDLVNPQYIEVKFVSARTIEWLYLIGGYRNSAEFAEPSSISTELSTTLTGFTIQYWTGTSWTAVSELSRVDGTNAWRRISFTPVTTDRVRLVLPTLAVGQQFVASELEVWTVASDTTPNAFAFAPASSVALSTAVQSGAITPIGFNAAAPISVSGGSYSIGCNGVFTTTAGTLQPGQSVCVRHTSAASGASTVTTTLTIGGVAGTFSSTTQTVIVPPSDVTPDAIASQTIIDVAVTSTIYFAPFSVTGINAPATLTIGGTAGLEVSVGCTAAFSTTPTTVTNGQSICVRHVSANAALTNAVSTLTIGTVTVTFTSRTVAAALTCSFDFTGNGSVASDDALIFTRWLLGIRGDALISGITPYPAGTSPAQFAVSVANRMSIGLAHDLDGNGTVDALTDGLLLLRMSQGLMGTAVTANALGIGAVRGTHSLIGSYANTSCGTSFLLPAPPTVTSVSPLTGAKDTWTVVRVVGTDLPATVSLVVDGQNINPCNTSRPSSVTSIDFWCPLRVIGAHTARVIVAYVAPAQQQQIGSTQSFIVYAPNIAITSFSPISRAGQFAFTVVGVDMPGTLGADIGGVNCGVSRVALATDGAFNCNVSTLPSGYHTVTIRDTSNGAILRQFTGAQGFLVP